MINKQIIIDGIDVSGCEFYKNTNWKNCYSRDYKESVCQSNHNCLYKQIKRKEQECSKWKNAYEVKEDALTESEEYCEELEEKLKAKEQECEELKEKLILKEVAIIELSDDVKKYSKAIDEIEEIADNNCEIAEMEQIFLIIGGLDV